MLLWCIANPGCDNRVLVDRAVARFRVEAEEAWRTR